MEHKLQSNEVGFVNNKDGKMLLHAPISAICGQRILFRNIFCPDHLLDKKRGAQPFNGN